MENIFEPNNTGNHKKWREPLKMFIYEQKALRSQTTLGTTISEGNHPKCWFWAESTLEKNNTVKGNYLKCWFWVENTLGPNYTGNQKIRGTTQNVDFEQEALRSQTTLWKPYNKCREPPNYHDWRGNVVAIPMCSLFEIMDESKLMWTNQRANRKNGQTPRVRFQLLYQVFQNLVY